MPIIGRFKLLKTGEWLGEIATLCINAELKLTPVDREHDRQPAF